LSCRALFEPFLGVPVLPRRAKAASNFGRGNGNAAFCRERGPAGPAR
jgi:hypothetical protein